MQVNACALFWCQNILGILNQLAVKLEGGVVRAETVQKYGARLVDCLRSKLSDIC